MMKPFGKPVRAGLGLTRGMRFTLALWVAALPAWLLCLWGARRYPTLADRPFFWPSIIGFWALYGVTIALWLRRRPSPRGPWESSRTKLFLVRLALGLLIAAAPAFLSGYLYNPALKMANGILTMGRGEVEIALVDKRQNQYVLDSPYWGPDFQWPITDTSILPKDVTIGSIARVRIRRGLLGARWVDKIEFTVLR